LIDVQQCSIQIIGLNLCEIWCGSAARCHHGNLYDSSDICACSARRHSDVWRHHQVWSLSTY